MCVGDVGPYVFINHHVLLPCAWKFLTKFFEQTQKRSGRNGKPIFCLDNLYKMCSTTYQIISNFFKGSVISLR